MLILFKGDDDQSGTPCTGPRCSSAKDKARLVCRGRVIESRVTTSVQESMSKARGNEEDDSDDNKDETR